MIQNYKIIEKIASGSEGTVFKTKYKNNKYFEKISISFYEIV